MDLDSSEQHATFAVPTERGAGPFFKARRQYDSERKAGTAHAVEGVLWHGPEPVHSVRGLTTLPGEDYDVVGEPATHERQTARETAQRFAHALLNSTYQPILQQCNQAAYASVQRHLDLAVSAHVTSCAPRDLLPASVVYLGGNLSEAESTMQVLQRMLCLAWWVALTAAGSGARWTKTRPLPRD
jgi:hypothetical protein